MYKVCFWDEVTQSQQERDATPEEISEIESRKNAHPTQAEYITAAEALYDSVAQAKHYDDRYTCALRAGYSGPFQQEGQAFATWMDNQNNKAYQIMAEVLSGTRPQPTIAEFLALFDSPPWPA